MVENKFFDVKKESFIIALTLLSFPKRCAHYWDIYDHTSVRLFTFTPCIVESFFNLIKDYKINFQGVFKN